MGDFPLVASAGDLRLTHPRERGPDFDDARAELTQQQAAFEPAADPRGYGDPDAGWRHIRTSTAPGSGTGAGHAGGLGASWRCR
ncbi:hypothetical protein LV779_36605 [Streptomyces thinghirensis]|nr:hypothetical protein [Streptomyces thinghirensis]